MDVFVIFVALFVATALVVAVLARRKTPLPSTARSTEPGNVDPERDQTLDRPAGPGAEADAVPAPGDAAPGVSQERRRV